MNGGSLGIRMRQRKRVLVSNGFNLFSCQAELLAWKKKYGCPDAVSVSGLSGFRLPTAG